MKHCITTLIPALAISLVLSSPAIAQKKEEEKKPQPIVAVWQNFMNLPKEQREEYSKKLVKAQNLFSQKRIFDALEKVDELDKIFPNHPAALNIKGACYVEIRAFKKANAIFEEILKVSPGNTNVQFNLAEVDFVTKNWQSAHARFTKLIPLLPSNNKAMIRLCEFKLMLCQLKTDRVKEAIALKDKYDTWDDSPFYYYSRAAILYNEEDKEGADKMLSNARFVWRKNDALSAWQDTLIEFGYIRSFYGGDADEEK
jgi:tetratricopeptide (TPR) repeat protein